MLRTTVRQQTKYAVQSKMLFWFHRGIFFDQFVSHFHPGIMEFKNLLGISMMRTDMKFHVSPFSAWIKASEPKPA